MTLEFLKSKFPRKKLTNLLSIENFYKRSSFFYQIQTIVCPYQTKLIL